MANNLRKRELKETGTDSVELMSPVPEKRLKRRIIEEEEEEEEDEKKEEEKEEEEEEVSVAKANCIAQAKRWRSEGHVKGDHSFTDAEVKFIQKNLLLWFARVKRDLPWRFSLEEVLQKKKVKSESAKKSDSQKEIVSQSQINFEDDGTRAYAVWVSEIMLQQTQVATVIEYYNRWMKMFPTVADLAAAELEDVNKVWAGLGYYSRAKRLHEGAKKVVDKFGGVLPSGPAELEKEVPGIGPYTAGAIASIAFGTPAPVVDGNVVRVLSRLRALGGDPKAKTSISLHWELAGSMVHKEQPGDFNQALMELGATICTPTNPSCAACPVQDVCCAYQLVQVSQQQEAANLISGSRQKGGSTAGPQQTCEICGDIEDSPDVSVTRFPQKVAKKAVKEEVLAVCILERVQGESTQVLLVQRPKKGLLAGLWEFPAALLQTTAPSQAVPDDEAEKEADESPPQISKQARESAIDVHLQSLGIQVLSTEGVCLHPRDDIGSVNHIFTHLKHTYLVERILLPGTTAAIEPAKDSQGLKWVDRGLVKDEAVPTAVKKMLALLEMHEKNSAGKGPKGKGGALAEGSKKSSSSKSKTKDPSQGSLDSFFKKA